MERIKKVLNKENLVKFKKKYFTKKQLKNYGSILLQICIVVGVLSGLLFLGKKALDDYTNPNTLSASENVTKSSEKGNGEQKDDEAVTVEKDKYQGAYYLLVNTRHNTIVAYGYDKEEKLVPMKIMLCTIGQNVEKGKFEINEKYPWVCVDKQSWNQYNSRVGEYMWIQSAGYFDKNKYSLNVSEYNNMGSSNENGLNVKLSVADAKWIYDNCRVGTKIEVGNEKKLPLAKPKFKKISKIRGWDPTDPNKYNPWKAKKKNQIAGYRKVIKVERGAEVNYLANVIALDSNGKDITKKLNYIPFDTNETGMYKVKYTYGKKKKKLKNTLTYEVVDTTPPVILVNTENKSLFTFKIKTKNFTVETLNGDELKAKIRAAVLTAISVKDLEQSIIPQKTELIFPEKLYAEQNMLIYKAEDIYGNAAYKAIYIEIKEKKTKKKKPENEMGTKEEKPTTQKPTKQPTTQNPTSQKPTTQRLTTQRPTTQKPTTQSPTTTTKPTEPDTSEEVTPGGEESAGDTQ